MKTKKEIETMLATENYQAATEVMNFINGLSPDEKKEFLVFIQGIQFAKEYQKSKTRSA